MCILIILGAAVVATILVLGSMWLAKKYVNRSAVPRTRLLKKLKIDAIYQIDVYTKDGTFTHRAFEEWGVYRIENGFFHILDTDNKRIAYRLKDIKLYETIKVSDRIFETIKVPISYNKPWYEEWVDA